MPILHLTAGGYEADICPERGANLIRLIHQAYKMDALRSPSTLFDFERENPFLFGMPLLFFPNRISNARFFFRGREYIFPMNEPALHNHLHGTLHQTPFDVISTNKNEAILAYSCSNEKPYMTFPHAFTLMIRYSLSEKGVKQVITITNLSKKEMPVALGFHTTFRIPFVQGGKGEDVRLMLSVGKEIERDMKTFLPTGRVMENYAWKDDYLKGTFAPCRRTISRHYEMTAPGKMILGDIGTNAAIIYSPDANFHYWMVYNGGNPGFLCVEPQTWINNCPNAPFSREKTGFFALLPGEKIQYTTSIAFMRA